MLLLHGSSRVELRHLHLWLLLLLLLLHAGEHVLLGGSSEGILRLTTEPVVSRLLLLSRASVKGSLPLVLLGLLLLLAVLHLLLLLLLLHRVEELGLESASRVRLGLLLWRLLHLWHSKWIVRLHRLLVLPIELRHGFKRGILDSIRDRCVGIRVHHA